MTLNVRGKEDDDEEMMEIRLKQGIFAIEDGEMEIVSIVGVSGWIMKRKARISLLRDY